MLAAPNCRTVSMSIPSVTPTVTLDGAAELADDVVRLGTVVGAPYFVSWCAAARSADPRR
jgi:hypothetical protein